MFPAQRVKVVPAQVQPVLTLSAYSALDAVGQKLKFPGVTLSQHGGGYIHGITIFDKSQIKAALKLFLFDRDFTAVADNAAFAVSDADMANCVAVIASGSYEDIASTGSIYTAVFATPIAFQTHGGQSLYGQLRATATPTYTTVSDLVVKLHVSVLN